MFGFSVTMPVWPSKWIDSFGCFAFMDSKGVFMHLEVEFCLFFATDSEFFGKHVHSWIFCFWLAVLITFEVSRDILPPFVICQPINLFSNRMTRIRNFGKADIPVTDQGSKWNQKKRYGLFKKFLIEHKIRLPLSLFIFEALQGYIQGACQFNLNCNQISESYAGMIIIVERNSNSRLCYVKTKCIKGKIKRGFCRELSEVHFWLLPFQFFTWKLE